MNATASRVLPGSSWANRTSFGKRVIDYSLTIPLALLVCPVFAIVFALIKLVDRSGPAFFVQERDGLDGKPFPFFKFRTMYVDAPERLDRYLAEKPERRQEWETIFKLDQDPRVLPYIGNALRRTSLDELPNLLNILRGEMSLVGPRPFPAYHLDRFDAAFREKRSSVWPGLTGLWQIHRGGLDAQRCWDNEYIDHWSLVNDLRIIARTIPTVVFARKAHY